MCGRLQGFEGVETCQGMGRRQAQCILLAPKAMVKGKKKRTQANRVRRNFNTNELNMRCEAADDDDDDDAGWHVWRCSAINRGFSHAF